MAHSQACPTCQASVWFETDATTAAVHKALDALAKTHPTEAAELRKAVTFKEAP